MCHHTNISEKRWKKSDRPWLASLATYDNYDYQNVYQKETLIKIEINLCIYCHLIIIQPRVQRSLYYRTEKG